MSETIEVSAASEVKIAGRYGDVKELEDAIVEAVRAGAVRLYEEAWGRYQQGWLETRRRQYVGVRWRRRRMLTPFGEAEVPSRVVRQRGVVRGGYLSLGKVLRRGLATQVLSPALEKAAVEAAPEQNYRPAAQRFWQWWRVRVSHWLVWSCVQFYGAKLQEQQQRGWWAERRLAKRPRVVITEMDSAMLRTQRRGKLKTAPQRFWMHLALQYTGRERVPGCGRGDVRLRDKTVAIGTGGLGSFGRRVRLLRDWHYGARGYCAVVLSDGDEGLRWVRERQFPEAVWLLDRWHVAERVRGYVGEREEQFQRIMTGVYACDSEAVLEALRTSDAGLQHRRPQQFRDLFGYILGNRDGIDNYRQIPQCLRRSQGRTVAAVRPGSGAIEKQVEVHLNRRFKWQGRSWNPLRADRLAQLKEIQRHPHNWQHWWNQVCLSTIRVNPSWAPN